MSGFAWVTLATNDAYSLGALVLAHSLRRVNTAHQLVVLVTPGVSASMRNQLRGVFNLIEEVNVLDSQDEANLALMSRPELGITFTKLHCWRLTQYEKCVFLDADTMVLKNADELFDREELSAAPDPGWPDCFNSGVFVYRPSMDTFKALVEFAVAKGSFDGADQGLLNMFFADWATKDLSRHLPFIYNLVSSAMYSYLPAYKQFGENAKIVHFIGAQKPWLQYFDSETRQVHPAPGTEHLRGYLQLWWDIFCSTVHPSLSPEMAHRSSHETRVDSAMTTVSHFITDFFQKLEPMSVYTDFPPISTTPYAEDPSLGFWDPWETYLETPRKKLYDSVAPLDYHGSKQQREAFKDDERQTGWQRHHIPSSNSSESQSQIPQTKTHNTYYSRNEQHYQEVHHHQQQQGQSISHGHSQPWDQSTKLGQYSDSLQHSHHQPTSHDQHSNSHPTPLHHDESSHKHIHPVSSHDSHYNHSHHKESHKPEPPHHDASCQRHHQCENTRQTSHQSSNHQISHQEHGPVHQVQSHSTVQVTNSHMHHTHQDQQHNLYKSDDKHEYQTHQLQNHDQPSLVHNSNSHADTLQHNRQPDKAFHTNHKPQTDTYVVPPHRWERQKENDNFHPITPSQNHSDSNCKCVNVAIVSKSLNLISSEDKASSAAEFEAGLAGALAQLTLGVPRSAEQTALEEHMRRQAWEQGNADYMGRDSFDNIWRKICQTLSEAPAPNVQSKPSEATKASKPSKSEKPSESSEASKTSKESTAPSEAEKATSAVAKEKVSSEVTAPEEKPAKEDLPKTPSATPPTQIIDNSKQSNAQTGRGPVAQPEAVTAGGDMATTPATPSIIAATPPTSPPVLPSSVVQPESKSLIVDAPTPGTPPVGSELLKKDISSLPKEIKGISSESQALPQAVTHTVATVPVFAPPEAKVIPSVPSAKTKPQSETKAIPLPLSPEAEQAIVLPPVETVVKDMPVPPPPPPPAETKKAAVSAPTETRIVSVPSPPAEAKKALLPARTETRIVSVPSPPAEEKRAPIPLPPAGAKAVPIPSPPAETKRAPIPLPPAETKGAPIALPPAETKGAPVPSPPAETKGAPVPSPSAETKGAPIALPPAETKGAPVPSPPAETKGAPITLPPAETKGAPVPSPPAETKGAPVPSPPAETKAAPVLSPPARTKGVSVPSPPADAKGVPIPSLPSETKDVSAPCQPSEAKGAPVSSPPEAKAAPSPEIKAAPISKSLEETSSPSSKPKSATPASSAPSGAKSVPAPPSPEVVSSDSKVPVQPSTAISSDAAESKSVGTPTSTSEEASKSPSEAKTESKTKAEQPATKPKTPKGIPTPPVEETATSQAPVPPKRRGHKGGAAATAESTSASKPAQAAQGKGSKPGQKSKK